MYDDIVVQSQTNELIARDTNRELVLETHSNAVGKICLAVQDSSIGDLVTQ